MILYKKYIKNDKEKEEDHYLIVIKSDSFQNTIDVAKLE